MLLSSILSHFVEVRIITIMLSSMKSAVLIINCGFSIAFIGYDFLFYLMTGVFKKGWKNH